MFENIIYTGQFSTCTAVRHGVVDLVYRIDWASGESCIGITYEDYFAYVELVHVQDFQSFEVSHVNSSENQ